VVVWRLLVLRWSGGAMPVSMGYRWQHRVRTATRQSSSYSIL